MAQLNLICHGMMLFVEAEGSLDILVPVIEEHDYRIGSPTGTECGPYPAELAAGRYQVTGLPSGGAGLSGLNPDQHLLLHREKFDIVRAEHIAISIPKPSRVRLFRRVGPPETDVAGIIFGNVPRDTAFGVPTSIHDVIALIYEGIPDGTTVRCGGVRSDVVRDSAPTNICVYSQVGPKSMPEDTGNRPRHETGLNDLLVLRSGRHPDFMLSAVGAADPHTGTIGDGIDKCDLFSLFELAHFTTDGTGCSSAFVLMG